MRRLLTTLVILMIVLVAGMTALVLLVNPNDFRAYMIHQVEKKSHYSMTLDGDLRWHVWPQLSILTGRVTLTAPGAAAAAVSADNMRLDVQLLPLLSHQLVVKQVLLKGAVVRLTPDSEAKNEFTNGNADPADIALVESGEKWKFSIANLEIADSLLIWQRANNEQINVRDINLSMEQQANQQATIKFSSRMSRDQRELSLKAEAQVDLKQYPQTITAAVSQFDYQLDGAEIPANGIKGSGDFTLSYQANPAAFNVDNINLTANDSELAGSISATLSAIPQYRVDLRSSRLNWDSLSGWQPPSSKGDNNETAAIQPAPVVSNQVEDAEAGLKILRSFNAQLSLTTDTALFQGLNISQFALKAVNQQGHLGVSQFSGKLAEGSFSLPAQLDVTTTPLSIAVQPTLVALPIAELLNAFNLPVALRGALSLDGQFNGNQLSLAALQSRWHGKANLSISDAQLQGLNIQQLIQQAVVRNDNAVRGLDNYDRYTEVSKLSSTVSLNNQKLNFSNFTAQSAALSLTGNGSLALVSQQCDFNVNVQVLQGWQGPADRVAMLQNAVIPLQVYGPWDNLSYKLKVDDLLRNTLQERAKKALSDWADRNKDSQDGKDVKKLLDKL